jgi:hypothetical protein
MGTCHLGHSLDVFGGLHDGTSNFNLISVDIP